MVHQCRFDDSHFQSILYSSPNSLSSTYRHLIHAKATNPRAFHLPSKHHRFRHHHAIRRRNSHHLPRQSPHERSHATIDTLARPLHSRPPETRDPKPLLHHPRRPRPRAAENLLRGNDQKRHAWDRHWRTVWRGSERCLLQSVSATSKPNPGSLRYTSSRHG